MGHSTYPADGAVSSMWQVAIFAISIAINYRPCVTGGNFRGCILIADESFGQHAILAGAAERRLCNQCRQCNAIGRPTRHNTFAARDEGLSERRHSSSIQYGISFMEQIPEHQATFLRCLRQSSSIASLTG
jgi:hypothetical protein